jgi:RsiW-degrading membrane proteinase PrsW (M82 family)
VLIVNFIFDNPEFDNLQEELKHYKILNNLPQQKKIYTELLKEDPYNIDYNYFYIQTHFNLPKSNQSHGVDSNARNDNELINHYNKLSKSFDEKQVEIGLFGKGLCFYKLELYEESFRCFIDLEDQNIKYLNYLYSIWNYKNREEYYLKEVRCHSDNYLAHQGLADYYILKSKPQEIVALLQNDVVYKYLSNTHKRYAYFNTQQYLNYSIVVFERFFNVIEAPGLLGALLILVIWFIYLVKIHKFIIKRLITAILVLTLGMFFAFLTSLFTDFNRYVFDFHRTYNFFHDFYYCVVGIGMIEEFVKIIPLMLVITFTKKLKEPIDYIVFASISALGFAFIENMIYFEDSGLKTIQGRALTATVIHMFNSSLVAYGIVVGKFAKKKNVGLYFVLFFLISAVVHGFYDFWLINEFAKTFSFITFIWLLMSMIIWVSIINNCLNNSYNKKVIWTYNPKKLNAFLLYGLSAIFLVEYLLIGYKFGADIANTELQKDLSSGLFLLIFLTINLSKFDYIPNYWAPLKFWDWSIFLSIPRVETKFFNLKEIIGSNIKIKAFISDNSFAKHLPIEGEVVKRELISWEKDWYLIKLKEPLIIGWKQQHFVLVKPKDGNEIFLETINQIILVRLVHNIDHLSKKKKNKTDFPFLDFGLVSKELI